MMYAPYQRCIATVLLFSLLLQSCGSPSWKIADDELPRGASAKMHDQAEVKQHRASSVLVTATGLTECSIAPKVESTPALGGGASSQRAPEALVEMSSKSLSSPIQRSVLPIPSQCLHTSSPAHSSSATGKRKPSTDNRSHHVVLGKDTTSRRQGTPLATSRAVPVVVAGLPQLQVEHALKATARKEPRLKPAISLTLQSYPSAQGHQVRFQETDGKWLAQVQDVWGRTQLLPVICAPNQTPAQAIEKLASKAPGQHKYWVHVIETHQPSWVLRVVYVGALGIIGGGNSSSSGGGHHGSFDRGDRGSRRERNNLGTHQSTSADLLNIGIGSSLQVSVGHSANYSDSLAASRAVNEGMRLSNEIFGASGSSVFNSPQISASSPLRSHRDKDRDNLGGPSSVLGSLGSSVLNSPQINASSLLRSHESGDNLGYSSSVLGSLGSSVLNSPRINETPSFTTQGSGALSSLHIVRDPEHRVESMIRSTIQKMAMTLLKHNPDPVEHHMASVRLSSGLRSSVDTMGSLAPASAPAPSASHVSSAASVQSEEIKAYMAKWQEEKPSGRSELQVQGQAMLEQLEAIKKNTKSVYRKHMLGVEMPDPDPWVWSQSFQGQRTGKAQLDELRLMRGQLIKNLQPTEAALRKAGMHVERDASHDKVYYSSDEDEPPFPPRSKANHKVVAKPVLQAYDAKQMRVSQKGVDTISSHEGFSTKKYKVGGRGKETIGYGHEVLPGENFSQGITPKHALDLLEEDVKAALKKVQTSVKVPLKQHQLDALVSYVYNTGGIEDTRLLEKLNAGDFEGAAREMDIVTQKGTGGKVLQGLVKRREAEQKLFLYGYDK